MAALDREGRPASPGVLDRAVRVLLRIAYATLRLYWAVAKPTLRGALVAVWVGDELLLIRNSYRGGETLPAGGVHPAETPREAARRELFEEVGIAVDEAALEFCGEFDLWLEGKRELDFVFELCLDERPAIRIDQREVCSARFVARGDLRGCELRPPIPAYLEIEGKNHRSC